MKATELNAHLPYAFGHELAVLHNIAGHLQSGARVVVLGAGPGIMSMALLEANPEIRLCAVDISATVLDTYKKHLASCTTAVHTTCCGTTASLAESMRGNKQEVDFLIVDADHSYRGVATDIRNWWPLVTPGGLAFFHDYEDTENNGTNGVRLAIDENRADDWVELGTVGVSIVFAKAPNKWNWDKLRGSL